MCAVPYIYEFYPSKSWANNGIRFKVSKPSIKATQLKELNNLVMYTKNKPKEPHPKVELLLASKV